MFCVRVGCRTRGCGDPKSRLTLEELQLFYDQINSLACTIKEAEGVKQLLDTVTTFQTRALQALSENDVWLDNWIVRRDEPQQQQRANNNNNNNNNNKRKKKEGDVKEVVEKMEEEQEKPQQLNHAPLPPVEKMEVDGGSEVGASSTTAVVTSSEKDKKDARDGAPVEDGKVIPATLHAGVSITAATDDDDDDVMMVTNNGSSNGKEEGQQLQQVVEKGKEEDDAKKVKKLDTSSSNAIKCESEEDDEEEDEEQVQSEELSKLMETGLSLDIDLPELPRLRSRLTKVSRDTGAWGVVGILRHVWGVVGVVGIGDTEALTRRR